MKSDTQGLDYKENIPSQDVSNEPNSEIDDNFLLDSEFPPENLVESDNEVDDDVSEEDIETISSDEEEGDVSQENDEIRNKAIKSNIISQLNNRRNVHKTESPTVIETEVENTVPSIIKNNSIPSTSTSSSISNTKLPALTSSPFATTTSTTSTSNATATATTMKPNTPATSVPVASTTLESTPSTPNPDDLVALHRQQLRLFTELNKLESKLIVSFSMKSSPGKNDRGLSLDSYVQELEIVMNQKLQSILEVQKQLQLFKKKD